VLDEPAHPAWRAAASRLGDVDDGYLVRLEQKRALSDEDHAFFLEQLSRIDERARTRDTNALATRVVPMLRRAAWIDIADLSHEAAFLAWTWSVLRPHADDSVVRTQLELLRDTRIPDNVGIRMHTMAGALRDPEATSFAK
jgi:hypothetical protein